MSDLAERIENVQKAAEAFKPTDDAKADLKTLAGMIGDLAEAVGGTPKQVKTDIAAQQLRILGQAGRF